MTGSKYQQHYFGVLVIGQSSKIMFLIFLRWHKAKVIEESKARPKQKNTKSNKQASKETERAVHYFGALTNDQCSKVKFLLFFAWVGMGGNDDNDDDDGDDDDG